MNHSPTTGAVNSKRAIASERELEMSAEIASPNASWQERDEDWLSSKGRDILREAPEMRMSLLKNIRLSSASKQCAIWGGPQRLVYVVSAADKDKHRVSSS